MDSDEGWDSAAATTYPEGGVAEYPKDEVPGQPVKRGIAILNAERPPAEQIARIDNDFDYHAPTGDKARLHSHIRSTMKDAALAVAFNTPRGREQSLALTKLEEAMYWANAAIARN